MSSSKDESYRTLRGWSAGDEPNEETYSAYTASLRIFGNISDLDEITKRLELEPTSIHRQGERRGDLSLPYKEDKWAFQPDTPEEAPLEEHINALWACLKPHQDYLLELKQALHVDIFLGYRSNCDHGGIQIPHACLEMFTALQIPFSLSIIIA